jgi:hypothetical protein
MHQCCQIRLPSGNISVAPSITLCYKAVMPNPPESSADDPLGLEGVDREIRIEKLRLEIDEVAGVKCSAAR